MNMENAISNIKQPAPSTIGNNQENKENQEKKYRILPSRNIGMVDAPSISKTPLGDMISIKKEENPKAKYQNYSNKKDLSAVNIISLTGVFVCSILSLLKLRKKI